MSGAGIPATGLPFAAGGGGGQTLLINHSPQLAPFQC